MPRELACMVLRSDYLSQFHPAPSPQVPSFVSALTERMACRVLVFFVRHASLVRPLSNDGKLRLAKVGAPLVVHELFKTVCITAGGLLGG